MPTLKFMLFRQEQHELYGITEINWASSRETLSSGFSSKRVSNRSPQLQRLARKSKFRL